MDWRFIKIIVRLAYDYYKSKPNSFLSNVFFWEWYLKQPKSYRAKYEHYAQNNRDNVIVRMAVCYYNYEIKPNNPHLSDWRY